MWGHAAENFKVETLLNNAFGFKEVDPGKEVQLLDPGNCHVPHWGRG